jgi:hypothetical protein
MVENEEKIGFGMDSKFSRVLLVIITVLLIFAGPTYVPYLLSNILKVSLVASMTAGFVLFIAGLFLLLFLVRKKVIT